MSKTRKSITTTLDTHLYEKIQLLSLKLSYLHQKKINLNDLLEEGMKCILEKYENELDDESIKK